MIKAQTLKGFRDFLPAEARARAKVIKTITSVFATFGFDPLETPALEYAETLLGKYGSEADTLMYIFEDHGKRQVGLRYDQTVPLSRVMSQYPDLPKPFRRYQLQPVWRAENTQKGRYREFLQCDIDIIGSATVMADAEIITCALTAIRKLGLNDAFIAINDRSIFDTLGLTKAEIITIDKLDKIGEDGVKEQLKAISNEAVERFMHLKTAELTPRLTELFAILESQGYTRDDVRFDPYLARGLDYYTSTIVEIKVPNVSGSIGGGGRYDKLIGQFSGQEQPAIGLALGFDRIMDLLQERNILNTLSTGTKVIGTIFSPELAKTMTQIITTLRKNNIPAEITLDAQQKLEKQLKYADKKGIPYVLIIGPDEAKENVVKVKKLVDGSTEIIKQNKLVEYFRSLVIPA